MGGNKLAIKVIAVMGLLAFAFLFLSSIALKHSINPNLRQKVKVLKAQSPFNAARAFQDLEKIVKEGPRPAGSSAADAVRQYIKHELSMARIPVREQSFEATTPAGVKKMVNLIAEVKGTRNGVILLGGHYDTKYLPEIVYTGANDAGVPAAWLLEMARTLGPSRQGRTIWIVWFDGQESFLPSESREALYGSRAVVNMLSQDTQPVSVAAVITVGMIGDEYLDIARDQDAPDWLYMLVAGMANDLGYGRHFNPPPREVFDDQIPFREAGIPALCLRDCIYGGSAVTHRRYYHTAQDTLDKVSTNSLQAMGDVLYHALSAMEQRLDTSGDKT